MEDDHSQVIEELKTAIQYNDSEALKDTLSCYPEAVGGLVIDGVPLLHYICKQPVSCVDILKVVLEARGADVNQTSDEVGGEIKTSIEPFNMDVMGVSQRKQGNLWGKNSLEVIVYKDVNADFYLILISNNQEWIVENPCREGNELHASKKMLSWPPH